MYEYTISKQCGCEGLNADDAEAAVAGLGLRERHGYGQEAVVHLATVPLLKARQPRIIRVSCLFILYQCTPRRRGPVLS